MRDDTLALVKVGDAIEEGSISDPDGRLAGLLSLGVIKQVQDLVGGHQRLIADLVSGHTPRFGTLNAAGFGDAATALARKDSEKIHALLGLVPKARAEQMQALLGVVPKARAEQMRAMQGLVQRDSAGLHAATTFQAQAAKLIAESAAATIPFSRLPQRSNIDVRPLSVQYVETALQFEYADDDNDLEPVAIDAPDGAERLTNGERAALVAAYVVLVLVMNLIAVLLPATDKMNANMGSAAGLYALLLYLFRE